MVKKLLIPYSMDKAEPVGRSFIAPSHDGVRGSFVSLSNHKPVEFGMVCYLGKEVSPADFFARAMDSGMKILPSMDAYEKMIEAYFAAVQDLKVGDVVQLTWRRDGSVGLEKQSRPKVETSKSKLP